MEENKIFINMGVYYPWIEAPMNPSLVAAAVTAYRLKSDTGPLCKQADPQCRCR